MSELEAWMGLGAPIVHIPLRATLLLLLALGVSLLLQGRAASLRHRLWSLALVGLLLLPIPALLLARGVEPLPGMRWELLPPLSGPPAASPGAGETLSWDRDEDRSIRHLVRSWRTPVPAAETLRNNGLLPPGAAISEATPPRRSSPLGPALIAIWLAGVAVVLVRAARSRRRARLLLRLSEPADPALWPGIRGVDARESDAIDLPITIGALRPVVLLPRTGRDWPLAWRRSAVAHEVAHLRRHDPLLQLVSELATALYWYHPLAWLAARRLRVERELAADDDVLLQGNLGSDYAQLLVTLACAPDAPVAAGAVLPLLTPAGLKARLLGILNPRRIRNTRRAAMFGLGLAAALTVVPVAAALPVRALISTGVARPAQGMIIGRVVDDATGRPLAGVDVDFLLAQRVLRTTSGADGSFRSPVPGARPPHDYFNLYARRGSLAARTTVMAVPFGTELPLELRVKAAHQVRGRVVSAQGRPIAGAKVHVIDWQSHAVGPGGGPLAETRADGTFVVEGLLYGDYSLLAVAPSGVAAVQRVGISELDPADAVIRLPDTNQVTARLQDDSGRALAGVLVERAPSLNQYPRGRTGERHVDWDVSAQDGSVRLLPLGETLVASGRDASGQVIEALFSDGGVARWQVPTLDLGRARVSAPAPGRVVLLQRPAVLDIRVEDAEGRPVSGVRPRINPVVADPGWMHIAREMTGADGRLPAVAVPPGTMAVGLGGQGLQVTTLPERVVVSAGERKQVRLVVPTGAAAASRGPTPRMQFVVD